MSQIFSTLPKLKEIAAVSIAVTLWNHFDVPNAVGWNVNTDYNCSLSQFQSKVIKFTEALLLPKLLTKLIETYIIKISSEITRWIIFHHEKIPLIRKCHLFCHFSEIIWYPNCAINDKETALNLQNSKFLNEIEKFQFLCLYCLKNEIELKRKLFGNKFFDHVFFRDHPLLYYWDRCCKNELQDLPVTGGLSIDEFMFRQTQVDNWPAKEYFFDRMNVDEQIQNTIWILDQHKLKYQKLIIVKLNHFQRRTLYMNRLLQILTNYLSDCEYFDDILPTWFEAAHIINDEDFAIFLRTLCLRKINDRIIAEIWINASDALKLYVLKNESEVTVSKIWDLWIQTYDKNTIIMLLDTNRKIIKIIRNMAFFSNHCKYLLAHNKLLMLEKVLNLCFKSDEELAPIKKNLAQSESFSQLCQCLILANDFFTLEQLFRLFSEAIDLDVIKKSLVCKNFFKDHCKNLAKGGEIPVLDKLLNIFCSSEIEKLEKSIRDRFDSITITDCCKKLIMKEKLPAIATLLEFFRFGFEQSVRSNFFVDYCENLKERDELSKLENLSESLFPSAGEFITFRRGFCRTDVFVDRCQSLIISDQLSKLNELLNSIFPNVEELIQFKREFSMKPVFFNFCLKLLIESELQRLRTLLEWFYSSVEESVAFKRAVSQKKAFGDLCNKLITSGQLSILEESLNFIFPSVEESIQFKKDLTKEKFFNDHCLKLIIDDDLPRLKLLFEMFLPSTDEAAHFKQTLSKEKVFDDHCQRLITSGQLSTLDELLNLIFPCVEESVEFKQDLIEKKFFIYYCLKLMNGMELQKLRTLFVYFYPCIEESAPFRRALRQEKVFSDYCQRLISSGQLSELDESLNIIFPDVEESVQFRQDLSTKKFFIDHCLKLIIGAELQTLETLFVWVYPCIEKSVSFKRALSKEKAFDDHCKKLISSGQLLKLDELLNLIFPNAKESIQFKMDLSTKMFFSDHCLKSLIEGELERLKTLLVWFYPCIEDFVQFQRNFSRRIVLGDYCKIFIKSGQLSKLNELLNLISPSVEESIQFKQDLSLKTFFINHCLKLLIEGGLQSLRTLFVWVHPCIEKSVLLQRAVSKEKRFFDHCQKLITKGELSELDETLNLIFPNVEESAKFKQILSTKKFFIDHCLKFIINDDLQKLKIVFLTVFPCIKNLNRFKRWFREMNIFGDHCRSLIINNELPKLEELLNLFFSDAEEIATFKKKFVEENWFVNHCQNLINSYQLTILDELLTWCFSDDVELNRFKSNLAFSNFVEEKCLFFYRTENIECLNNLLNLLFRHRYESIYEYKQNLLLSEDGVKVCFFLANQPNSVLDDMIIDCLPASASIADFKKNLIFSSVAISKLKKMVQENLLADVKKCFDQFLASAEDKKSLKRHLLDDPKELITLLFFKCDRFACESEMKWWFEDETAVHRCKNVLSVDAVFMAGLKECVFKTFDRFGRVSRCILKENFDLGALDWFLSWYFESSKEIKEYKVRKMKSYEDIDTICLLLKKGCRYSYFKELFNWFFENDAVEMMKFQRKRKGEKITTKMNIV